MANKVPAGKWLGGVFGFDNSGNIYIRAGQRSFLFDKGAGELKPLAKGLPNAGLSADGPTDGSASEAKYIKWMRDGGKVCRGGGKAMRGRGKGRMV